MDAGDFLRRYVVGQRNFSQASLVRIDLTEADLREVDLSRASLPQATLSGAILSKANLSRANLSGATLSRANLSDADLSKADLTRAKLSAVTLNKANLSEADLSGASLIGADLNGATLINADLVGANLSGATLTDVDLAEADLSGATLLGADLNGVILEGTILSETIMPDGKVYKFGQLGSGEMLDGVTLASDQPEDLLCNARTVLSRSGMLGADYRIDTSHSWSIERLEFLRQELPRAIELQEFEVYYQPIVSLTTGRVGGFEALVRWRSPRVAEYFSEDSNSGLILPARFIPAAEETGIINDIDRWVLHEACRQMHTWQTRFPQASAGDSPLLISLNLSSNQFSQPDIVQQIEQALQETSLDAHSLGLEITEGMLLANAESAFNKLVQLKALGIRLYIVGLGTNVSSLGYLKMLPFDALKISRLLTSRVGTDREGTEIVRTLVMLAQNLRMAIIAEGIETVEQLRQLKPLNCLGQGHFFHQPMNSEVIEGLLAAWQWRVQSKTSFMNGSAA